MRLNPRSMAGVAFESIRQYRRHDLSGRSAQFAYYSIVALAPLLIVVVATVAQLPIEGVLDRTLEMISVGMPDSATSLIRSQIQDLQARSNFGLLFVGLVLLGTAGSRVFLTVAAALDAAYEVEHRRRFWLNGLLVVALTFAVLLLTLIGMVLLVVGPMVTDFFLEQFDAFWLHVVLSSGVRWAIAIAFMLIATTFIYWIIPSADFPFTWISPGSVFATVGWLLGTQGLRIYVENFGRYNETYGALGAVIVLLLWLYLSGAILMMGGQINAVVHKAKHGSLSE